MKKKVLFPLLSIDPGVEFGWALWNNPLSKVPTKYGIVIPPRVLEWEERISMVIKRFAELIDWHSPATVCCELPCFMNDLAARSNNLVKLAYAAGSFEGVATARGVKAYRSVPVNEWKGQLPKRVVSDRIQKLLTPEKCTWNSHVWDAVGIGLYVQGYFK
jgi:Holliday junction resolvasome RuvABC endonuclease subunit